MVVCFLCFLDHNVGNIFLLQYARSSGNFFLVVIFRDSLTG